MFLTLVISNSCAWQK